MPYTLEWFVDRRVLYLRLYDVVELEDMLAGSARIGALIDEGIPLVHIIVDDRDLKSTPTSIKQVSAALEFMRKPALGWLISIGKANPIFNFVSTLVAQVFRARARRIESLDAALEFLEQQDQSIPWNEAHTNILSA